MEEHPSRINRAFGGSFALELTGKIMVVAVLILFMVIVFVLILQLYSRWLLSRIDESTTDSTARRRSDQESAVATTLRKGLDAAVLRLLPVVVFSTANFKEGLECAVCLSELGQGEKARLLPRCNHGFHVDCIDMWFKSNSTCPLCRDPVAPKCSNPTQTNSAENLESREENLESGSSMESPIFPTNILFWGNQMQVSSRGVCLEEAQTSSSSSSPNTRADGRVVIDIPNEPSTSSSGTGGCSADEEIKPVVTNRLRTLKRLLSRERRIGNNPISSDLEQVEIGQS